LSPSEARRTCGTGELDDRHARAQFGEALLMPVEHREPDRHLVAEGHGQRLLQMGAPGHRRVAVLFRERSEDGAQFADVGVDAVQRIAHLQRDGRVHDVLRGRTPMHVPGDVGLVAHVIEVDALDLRFACDHLGCIGGDHADSRFGLRQRRSPRAAIPSLREVRIRDCFGEEPGLPASAAPMLLVLITSYSVVIK
jgi:hypothetical protein